MGGRGEGLCCATACGRGAWCAECARGPVGLCAWAVVRGAGRSRVGGFLYACRRAPCRDAPASCAGRTECIVTF
eukprot:scaffold6740_cov126-Isochrysis_galbana.AAC.5